MTLPRSHSTVEAIKIAALEAMALSYRDSLVTSILSFRHAEALAQGWLAFAGTHELFD